MTADSGAQLGPRVERSRMLILEAAVEELADVGYGGVTIESIAARAGVGKATIHRHWPDKLRLIADAFETFHEQMASDLGDLPVRESVALLLRHVVEVVIDSTFSRCIPALSRAPNATNGYARFTTATPPSDAKRSLTLIARGVQHGQISTTVGPELATTARADHHRALGSDLLPTPHDQPIVQPSRCHQLVNLVLG